MMLEIRVSLYIRSRKRRSATPTAAARFGQLTRPNVPAKPEVTAELELMADDVLPSALTQVARLYLAHEDGRHTAYFSAPTKTGNLNLEICRRDGSACSLGGRFSRRVPALYLSEKPTQEVARIFLALAKGYGRGPA